MREETFLPKELFGNEINYSCEDGSKLSELAPPSNNPNAPQRWIHFCPCCGKEGMNNTEGIRWLVLSCEKCGTKLKTIMFGKNKGRSIVDIFCGEPEKIIKLIPSFIDESLKIIFFDETNSFNYFRSCNTEIAENGNIENILDTISESENSSNFFQTLEITRQFKEEISIQVFENRIVISSISDQIKSKDIGDIIESYLLGEFINFPLIQGIQSDQFSHTFRKLISVEGSPSYITWAIKKVPDFVLSNIDIVTLEKSDIFHLKTFNVQRIKENLIFFVPVLKRTKFLFDEKTKKHNSDKFNELITRHNAWEAMLENESYIEENYATYDYEEEDFYAMTDGMLGSYDDFFDGGDSDYIDNYFGR